MFGFLKDGICICNESENSTVFLFVDGGQKPHSWENANQNRRFQLQSYPFRKTFENWSFSSVLTVWPFRAIWNKIFRHPDDQQRSATIHRWMKMDSIFDLVRLFIRSNVWEGFSVGFGCDFGRIHRKFKSVLNHFSSDDTNGSSQKRFCSIGSGWILASQSLLRWESIEMQNWFNTRRWNEAVSVARPMIEAVFYPWNSDAAVGPLFH
jgi:hypothetical protein